MINSRQPLDVHRPPLISVIIPCYNQARYLGEAIDSVLAQTYPHREVVVVNDGSTDNTSEVMHTYSSRILSVEQANRGLPGARNSGLRVATGEYVVFLDSDDLLEPTYLEHALALLQPATASLVVSGWLRFSDSLTTHHQPPPGQSLIEPLCRGSFPVHAALVRRSALDAAGNFDETLRSHEDLDLWWRMALQGATFLRNEAIEVRYRQHAESMSRNRLTMLVTCADVQLRYFAQALQGDNELQLLAGEHFVNNLAFLRRQILLWDGPPEMVARLWQAQLHLQRVGFSVTRRWWVSPIYGLLGSYGDVFVATAAKRLFPKQWRSVLQSEGST